MRSKLCEYPDYTAFIDALDSSKTGGTLIDDLPMLLGKIITKHFNNAEHTRNLYDRYKVYEDAVPIFTRQLRFGDSPTAINNKVNTDFFGEIIDFFVGYFGYGTYSYSDTKESEEDTGGDEAVELATKTLSDFVTRNNMVDKDTEITKFATICGYVGRLLYHDLDGQERVMVIPPYECVALARIDLSEPQYAVRFYETENIDGNPLYKAEFYDSDNCYFFEGNSYTNLTFKEQQPTLFGACPLQVIVKNLEMIGDAEKVIDSIDAYDRVVSDCNNETENFTNSILAFKDIKLTDDDMKNLRANGTIQFMSTGMGNGGEVYYVTKQINDTFTENHLDRLKNDIYRVSKTPNLSDGTFGQESGEARKFRLTGIESKCRVFESKMSNASVYMFKLLANAWNTKGISFDPLQAFITWTRNFPIDFTTEAQAVSTLIASGFPKSEAFGLLSFVDDPDYIMQCIENEKSDITPFYEDGEQNSEEVGNTGFEYDEDEQNDDDKIEKEDNTQK